MEAMTDPNSDGIHATAGGDNEIADGEAQNYGALVGGYEVSSFWSARDNAYAVYDGNSQVVLFDNGNLIVNGDQFGPGTNDTITVDAGVVLQVIQETAKANGRLFPLSLGAEGSCQIGGNISTNAGGVQALRYG